ncbi:hypothetical protein Tco_0034437 [Tanacetum coccineum]
MVEKSMYDSWVSRVSLFLKRKKHDRMMLDSIDNGLLVYPTVEDNGQTRPKKYSELTEAQQLQDDCDVQATDIILSSLPPDMYALVNHQEAAKVLWDKVKMLMKGTELSYQEQHRLILEIKQPFGIVESPFNKFKEDKIRVMLVQETEELLLLQREMLQLVHQEEKKEKLKCTQPKRPRNDAWFKEKLMLAEAQEAGQTLDEEQLAFLADPGILEALVAQ